MTPYQQTPSPAFLAPPPTQQPPFSVSLQKQQPYSASLQKQPQPVTSTTSSASPSFPPPSAPHPDGLEPINPTPQQPLYPVLEGYQYPFISPPTPTPSPPPSSPLPSPLSLPPLSLSLPDSYQYTLPRLRLCCSHLVTTKSMTKKPNSSADLISSIPPSVFFLYIHFRSFCN